MNDEEFMDLVIEEAKKSLERGDFPAGSIIVKNGKIISKELSSKITTKDPTGHAELNAMRKACKELNSGFLDECALYVNIEPCLMCANAMIRTRIKKVIYGINHNEYGDTSFNILKQHNICKNIEVVSGIKKKKSQELLNKFIEKRGLKQ